MLLRAILQLVILVAVYSARHDREDHLTITCNAGITTLIGGRLEASTQLTYDNNMDCVFHIQAPPAKQLLVLFHWFDLERKANGVCFDYLNIHDGTDVTASTLNTEPLCGEQRSLGNITSTGRDVTFHFVTDNDAVYKGFDLTYTVFSHAPCGGDDFACANNLCIDSSLQCDGLSQCGDLSDEKAEMCTKASDTPSNVLSMGAILGIISAALFLVFIIAVIVYKIVDYYKWKKWLRHSDLQGNPWGEEEVYQYPVTKLYHVNAHPLGDDVTAKRSKSAQKPEWGQEVTSEEAESIKNRIVDFDGEGEKSMVDTKLTIAQSFPLGIMSVESMPGSSEV